MPNIVAFRERIRELYRRTTPFDGQKPNQADLADAIGLSRSELNNRLNGSKNARLTPVNIRAIVRTLAQWEAIETEAEARELLALMACPDFSQVDWQTEPLCLLTPDAADAGSARATPPARHNLPLVQSSFIGRERQLSDITRLLRDAPSWYRLLTLTGVGGCGKTRLAIEAASRIIPEFAAGVWLIELAGLRDPKLIVSALAEVLGVSERQGEPLIETLIGYLAPKSMLIVLDNCEHLLSGAAQVAARLLQGCPRLQILATSREPLRTPGERIWSVPPLMLPEADTKNDPADLERYEAVALFVARAQALSPQFVLGPSNALAVRAICVSLDGLPLAIELAAARTTSLAVIEIQRRLDQRFALLDGGYRTDALRQQTLRSLIDWSYDLLASDEQILFRRLSVFVGGFSLAALEQVCGAAPLEPDLSVLLLGKLVDKSMVVREGQEEASRYRLYESLREYGTERLSAAEAQDLRERHREWISAIAVQAAAPPAGTVQKKWFDLLEADIDNLRAALEWSSADSAHIEVGVQLGFTLRDFWLHSHHLSEGRRWLEQLLDNSRQVDPSLRARLLDCAGYLAISQSDDASAQSLLEECLAIRRELGDGRRLAYTLDALGWVAISQDNYAVAERLVSEALDLLRGSSDQQDATTPIFYLGRIAHYRGRYAEAKELLGEVLRLNENPHSDYREATITYELGAVWQDEGGDEHARRYFERSLELARKLGDAWLTGHIFCALGRIACHAGDYDLADKLFKESMAIAQKREDRGNIALVLSGQGVAAQQQGWDEEAAALFTESLRLAHALGYKRRIATLLEQLAVLAAKRQEAGRAARLFGAAAALRERLATPVHRADQSEHDSAIAAVRLMLGAPRFDLAAGAGAALPTDQLIKEVLAQTA